MEGTKKSAIGDVEYKVEAVVDKRTIPCNGGCDGIIGCNCNGRVEYRIKWLGYGSECNTWEPLKHLYCEDLIEEFEQKLTKRKPDKGEKSKVLTPGIRGKSLGKRKNSAENCALPNEGHSSTRLEKRGKRDSTVATKKLSITSSKNLKKYNRKSVDFQDNVAQKHEISEKKDKKHYRKRSDAVSHISPDLDPEKIVGAADSGGELMFLIKWKGIL